MYQQNAGTFWQADPQQIFHEEVVLLKGRIFKNWQQNSTLPFSRQETVKHLTWYKFSENEVTS